MDFRAERGAGPGSGPLAEVTGVTGDFWIRLTVRAQRPWRVGRPGEASVPLGDWAAEHGFEVTHRALDRGRTPCGSVVSRQGHGPYCEQVRAAGAWAGRLDGAGFTVLRTRIEAAPWNDGVPGTDAEASGLPGGGLFVHRITLRLPIPYDTRRLALVAHRHGAQVARDARRVLSRGTQERVVVQSLRGLGRPTARARLDGLLDELLGEGFRPVDAEESLVLYDDGPALDAGRAGECG
jgi:hypothetical protein